MSISPTRLRRYHHKVYFPAWENLGSMVVEFFSGLKKVDITHHAATQLLEDKRGIIPLPSKQELMHPTNTLVEFYELLDRDGKSTGTIQKALIRIHNLSEKFDYSYIIARDSFLISAWANDKNDDHRLDRSKNVYFKPKE